jgi:hypothetical protein
MKDHDAFGAGKYGMRELLSIHDIASDEFRSALAHSIRNGLTSCIRLATSERSLPMRGSMPVLVIAIHYSANACISGLRLGVPWI